LKHGFSSVHLNNWGDNDQNNMTAMSDLRKLNKTLTKNVSCLICYCVIVRSRMLWTV
jgi:hypothetical protein